MRCDVYCLPFCARTRLCDARVRGALVLALAATLSAAGCGPDSDPGQSQDAAAKTTIELSPSQLHAIKISPASTFAFPVIKEAVGSVSFEDDPALVQAESTLVAAAATYDLTHKELVRVRTLGNANGIAQKEMEQAISDAQTAEAALKAARDGVRALGKTDAEIDRMVRTGRTEAPLSGNRTAKWVDANVAESDSASCRTGQAVEVRVVALPGKVFKGTVSEVYAAVDPNSHYVTVRALIADPDSELRAGMAADVIIDTGMPQLSIGVPEDGIVREGDGSMTAWATADRHHFVQRTVKTGLREDGRVQVLEGLRQGELVVTEGAIFLDNMLQAPPSD